MNWFLVISLFSTDDVLIRQFNDKSTCEIYKTEHLAEFKKDPDIKDLECAEGSVLSQQQDNAI